MEASALAPPPFANLINEIPDDGSERSTMLRAVLSAPMPAEDVEGLRRVVMRYFADRLSEGVDRAFTERGVTPEMLDKVVAGEMELDDLPRG